MSTGVVSHTGHCRARAPAVVLQIKLLGEQLELVVAEVDAQLGEHVVELLGSDVASVVGVHRAELAAQVVPHVVDLQQARHSSLMGVSHLTEDCVALLNRGNSVSSLGEVINFADAFVLHVHVLQ